MTKISKAMTALGVVAALGVAAIPLDHTRVITVNAPVNAEAGFVLVDDIIVQWDNNNGTIVAFFYDDAGNRYPVSDATVTNPATITAGQNIRFYAIPDHFTTGSNATTGNEFGTRFSVTRAAVGTSPGFEVTGAAPSTITNTAATGPKIRP
jgi:hypothetical protein